MKQTKAVEETIKYMNKKAKGMSFCSKNCNKIEETAIKVDKSARADEREKIGDELFSLVDTSIICLQDKQPSIPHDKLLFQLKSKAKQLNPKLKEADER